MFAESIAPVLAAERRFFSEVAPANVPVTPTLTELAPFIPLPATPALLAAISFYLTVPVTVFFFNP